MNLQTINSCDRCGNERFTRGEKYAYCGNCRRKFDKSEFIVVGRAVKQGMSCWLCGIVFRPGEIERNAFTLISNLSGDKKIYVHQKECWKKVLDLNEAAKARMGK